MKREMANETEIIENTYTAILTRFFFQFLTGIYSNTSTSVLSLIYCLLHVGIAIGMYIEMNIEGCVRDALVFEGK